MDFQRLIVVVVHVAVLLAAQVARQVHTVEVLLEAVDVEEVLLAEVTPRVGKDLSALLIHWVTMLNMAPKGLHGVQALFPNEHGATLDANFAESLLVS